MVVEVTLGILLALAILFIGLPVAIWVIGVVLNTLGAIFKAPFKMTQGDWANLIGSWAAAALALCSLPVMIEVGDILHGQWMVLVLIGTIIGILGGLIGTSAAAALERSQGLLH